MATSTITAALTLSGAGMTTQSLNVSRTISLAIGNPTIESGALKVSSAAFGRLGASTTAGGYMYVRNTEPTTAATIEIRYGTQSLGVLRPGEFMFVPIPEAAVQLEAKGSLDTTCEYGIWTKV